MVDTFYSAASQACLTLLGFWWAVIQFRHAEWMHDPTMRRVAYAVALHFLLPGIMSLVSLLAGDQTIVWRATFALAGTFGLIAVILLVHARGRSLPGAVGHYLSVPLYGLLTVVAVAPDVLTSLGLTLAPLQVEGIILSALVFLGINLAWLLFAAPAEVVGGPGAVAR